MGTLLYLAATHLLLGLTVFTASQVHSTSLKEKESTLRDILRYLERIGEATCADNINEILHYLEIGQEDIEKSDIKDVVVVLGPSGVGKSTLVQFVANSTNTLRAACEFGVCKVIDDSDTIGDDIISKTFLPNLVFHEPSSTPFYDMPGFNDNRNASIEIANSFFIQQVLEEAENIKIVILATFNSFAINEKQNFINLLKNVVELIKSPAQFRGGMAIFATIAPPHLGHQNLMGITTNFLKTELLDKIGEIFDEEQYISGSTAVLENFLESDTENFFDAKYVSYFLTPTEDGLLMDDPAMSANKKNLTELIWERLQFIPIKTGDFGYPLSSDAQLLISETAICISKSVVVTVDDFSESLSSHILKTFEQFNSSSNDEKDKLTSLLTNLTSVDFGFFDTEGETVEKYLEQLISIVLSLSTGQDQSTLDQLEEYNVFYNFMSSTGAEIDVEQKLWILPLRDLLPVLTEKLEPLATSEQLSTIAEIQGIATEISKEILLQVGPLPLKEKQEALNTVAKQLTDVQRLIEENKNDKEITILEFLASYENLLSAVRECTSCVQFQQKEVMGMFSLLSNTSEFKWRSNDWTSPVSDFILRDVQYERDLSIYLLALMDDLSTYQIQSNKQGGLVGWWSEEKAINQETLSALLAMTDYPGLVSSGKFDHDYISSIVLFSDNSIVRLKSLLDAFIGDDMMCSEGTNQDTVVVKNFLSLKDALSPNCLPSLPSRKSMTFIAMDTLYVDTSIIGLNYTNNIVLTFVAPTIYLDNSVDLDLSGKHGEQSGSTGATGLPGLNAGNFYLAYNGFDERSASTKFTVKLNGGIGGKGGKGAKGNDGGPGQGQGFELPDDCNACEDCDNFIRVYVQPNDCTSQTKPGYCHAVPYATVAIEGYSGDQGTDGSQGGSGGVGGAAGFQDIFNLDSDNHSTVYGDGGEGGEGGDGGVGGKGGKFGETLVVQVASSSCWNCRMCEEKGRYSDVAVKSAPDGKNGSQGTKGNNHATPQQPNKQTLNLSAQVYNEKSNKIINNEFVGAKVATFAEKLRTHFYGRT